MTHQGRHIALCAGDWKIQQVRLYTYRWRFAALQAIFAPDCFEPDTAL